MRPQRSGSRPAGSTFSITATSQPSATTIAALTALWGLLAGVTGPRTAIAIAGLLMLATPLLFLGVPRVSGGRAGSRYSGPTRRAPV